MKFFFDSYALIEHVKGNPKYYKYLDSEVFITVFNQCEFIYAILNYFGEDKAEGMSRLFEDCIIPVDTATLYEASLFRRQHKRSNFSYADSVGYITAKRNGLRFLTGDEQFRDLPNVEFVKM